MHSCGTHYLCISRSEDLSHRTLETSCHGTCANLSITNIKQVLEVNFQIKGPKELLEQTKINRLFRDEEGIKSFNMVAFYGPTCL